MIKTINLSTVSLLLDITMIVIFAIMALIFMKSDGKATKFIAGYNFKSPAEKKKYHEKKITDDFAGIFMLDCIVFAIGALLELFFAVIGSIAAWLAFMIICIVHLINCRNQNFDRKYKIPDEG